ncbi:MAG TPA: ATP-binding protein [Clostridia bacterium]|nr:ATP-binding protein [Clostridia bacterium]
MKTLLVLAEHPDLADAIRAGLKPEYYRVVHRTSAEEAEPLLSHGLAHACVLDLDLTGVQGLWLLEKLRRYAPDSPVIVFAGTRHPEWEEEAYLHGVVHVFTKPLRPRLLTAVLDRLWAVKTESAPAMPHPVLARPAARPAPAPEPAAANPSSSMGVLRSFSGILTHSLNSDAMLRQFLLQLREILSINRGAIFLRQPTGGLGSAEQDSRRLHAACSVGVPPKLLEQVELSLETGIGGQVLRLGRILRRTADEVLEDAQAQQEFEILGCQVAIPIYDHDLVLGVAVFDGRITGEPLVNPELELIFHLLEQVGLALRNIWLHDQLATNNDMLAGILRELGSACVVVSRDLVVLHANKAARRLLPVERRGSEPEFTDLPQVLGSKVYQVLKTGAAIANFRYEPADKPGSLYNVNVVPFQNQKAGLPNAALLMVEDLTQAEQLRRLEVETADLRILKKMADRLTAEIGNAMVPLSAHQQLLTERWRDAEFRGSLDSALADGVKRVTRLINQMRFLARDSLIQREVIPVSALLDEAYQEACKYQPAKTSQLQYDTPMGQSVTVNGDRAALKQAFAEVFLNALQANPAEPKIGIRFNSETNGNGRPKLLVDVEDNGAGFTPETAQKATAPFFSTRVVGVGLGLTVSRKIVETHHGKLEILPPKIGHTSVVRISLPVEAPATS